MESWTRVIIEWINCLEIAQPPVQHVQDLHDCIFYQKLISQLWDEKLEDSTTSNLDERELVSEFIRAEYPEFMVSNECSTGIPDELYIASLLLTQCSQKAAFHRPMCGNLRHETQVQIKKFLEMVLPYGKSITREIIGVAIMEIGDATPATPPSTPIVRPLREFFNSPVARSAQSQRFINDRNRELRRLKAQLETEQFEKADLLEDMKIQEEKINNLQKKLDEKSRELKLLRNEKLKPPTPQSSRKNKRPSDNEDRWKRELEQLENSNLQLQTEIEKLEEEREEYARRFLSKDRQYSALKEKLDQYERNIEAINIQLEMKNNELFGLRLNNEELREHIREIQKSTLGEMSFEMEPINRARSPILLNSSEALSSIVDIQLQEAKEESTQLKNQLDAVNQRLNAVLREAEDIKKLNQLLEKKTMELENFSVNLRKTEERLSYSEQKVECLELQKIELMENSKKLNDELIENKNLLEITKKRKNSLESDLMNVNLKYENIEKILENEKITTTNLETELNRLKNDCENLDKRLEITEKQLKKVNEEKNKLENDLANKIQEIEESQNSLIVEKSRVTEFKRLLADSNNEHEKLRILLENKEEKLTHVNEEKHLIELKLEKKMQDFEASEKLLKLEKMRIAELESTVDRVEEEYKNLKNLLESKEENLSELKENMKFLQQNLEESKKKLDETEISFNNEKSTVTELELIVASEKKISDDLKDQITINEKELSDLKNNNELLNLKLDESEKKFRESEISLTNEKTKLAEFEIKMSNLQKNFDDLQNDFQMNEKSLIMEREKVAELELKVARYEKDFEELKNCLERVKISLENEKIENAELKEMANRSKIRCEELENLLRSKEDIIEENSKRAVLINAELENCRLKISDLELSLRSSNSKSSELEIEFSRIKEHSEKLETELESKMRELENTEIIKRNAETELIKLNAEMRLMETNLEKIQNELSQVEDERKMNVLAYEEMKENAKIADEKICSLETKIDYYERKIEQIDKAAIVERQNVESLQDELTEKNLSIEKLTLRLEESEKSESDKSISLEAAKKKIAELTELGEEMESQLAQERRQLDAIRAEKQTLVENLASYASSEADLNEKVTKITQQLRESNEILEKQNCTISTLEKNYSELREAKLQLESEFEEEKEKLKVTLTEKINLEQELTSQIQSAANLEKKLCHIEKELRECDEKLENQQEKNSKLEEKNVALTENIKKISEQLEESEKNLKDQKCVIDKMRDYEMELEKVKIQLENRIEEESEKLVIAVNEKSNLQQELAKFVESETEANEKIRKIQEELNDCVAKLQKREENNAELKKENLALIEMREKVENEFAEIQEKLTIAEEKKEILQTEILSHVASSSIMEEKISIMQKDLEELTNNNKEQNKIIDELREKKRELEELKEKLEGDLNDERTRLEELKNEKEMLEEEASLYGASNKDLGNQIISLKTKINGYSKDLEAEREINEKLKKNHDVLNVECEKLKNEKMENEKILKILENEKKIMHEELSANAKIQADMNEEISALHTEIEGSRKDLLEIREINEILKEKIDSAENKVKNVEREKEIVVEELKLRLEKSDNLVESLEKRLIDAEESCVRAKNDEKMKQEALDLIERKLEISNREKMENEARMKEVIVNLQEVRKSQDGVLQAQVETLNEKTKQLEETEKELDALKKSLDANVAKMESEKLSLREIENQCDKLKEENQLQRKLIEELKSLMKIEQVKVEETTKRCAILEKNVKDFDQLTANLEKELNGIWEFLRKVCPEIARPEVQADFHPNSENCDIEKLSFTVKSFTDDAKIIFKALNILSEANEKLKSNMKEIVHVSENLKIELNALWDSVRDACPELARPKMSDDKTFDFTEISKITYAVKTFADDAKTIRKAVSILSEANETLKEHLDGEKEISKNSAIESEKMKIQLDERIIKMKNEEKNRNLYLSYLVERKKKLQELLSIAVEKRDQVDEKFLSLTEKWKNVGKEAQAFLDIGTSACDELKNLLIKRTEIDENLEKINDDQSRNLKPLIKTLCRIFVWSEQKLQKVQDINGDFSTENELSEEQEIVEKEIARNDNLQMELSAVNEKMETFKQLLESFEASLKSGAIKRPTSVEEKLQSQLDKISKERKEFKDKLDVMRLRNAKLEKNLDDLRNENKKLKCDKTVVASPSIDSKEELERYQALNEKLEKEILRLQIENDELSKKKENDSQDVENRLKEVHAEYGMKLEKIKQKMKTAYNEQISKLNQEQEKVLKEKIGAMRTQMEKQCRKYTEDIAKYKAHISDLSSRYWDVGEKLLTETQEKQAALRQLEQIRGTEEKHEASTAELNQQISLPQNRLKTASLDRRDFGADRAAKESTTRAGYRAVEVIEEETTTYSTRRHSVKSIQAMGNAFNAEDEEGEVFDSVYLADLKEGRCAPPVGPDFDRISELRMRNSMCRPHLRSSYAVETHFQPITLNEDDIKNGVNADDVFNDSLSQSLLPGQKPKKKDRTQTSYKRPGPPTPSKNGGRLSLQGNELKSPTGRILRERNVERRTTATPRGLKNLFGTSISKRQDENNATGTPKGRRLSNIFRKQRTERN